MAAAHVDEIFEHHDYSESSQIPFKSIEFLGRGAYGNVDKVERTSGQFRGRVYARKQFMVNVDKRRREAILTSFQNEVDIIKKVCHPHIICVIETYIFKKTFAIIMTPVTEEDLYEFLDRVDDTPLNSGFREQIPLWFGCLASGIAYLHAEGIRHRDIKPSNILIMAGKKIFLTDFGISVEIPEDTCLTTTENLGTPMYRAPEAADKKRSGRPADIFALGAVFLEMLTVHSGHKQLERFIESRRLDNGRYASNIGDVFGWMNYLGNAPRIVSWHSAILFLCQNMLQMERDKRPRADALRLCWSYMPFSAVPPTSCECISFPNDCESDSIEGINDALQRASESGHRLAAGLLIERGAIINYSGALRAASASGFEDIVQMLLEKGADIEAKDDHGWTALHAAAKHGHEATVQLLLEKGANIKAKDNDGQTALHSSASNGHEAIVRLLLKREANIDAIDKNGQKAVHVAAKYDHEMTVQLLKREEYSRVIPSIANEYYHQHNSHELSPTIFLRGASAGPDVVAIHHVTADSRPIHLTYRDFADRSRGLAYYLRKHGHKHVGILCPNTPAFLISIFGIAAAGAINTAANHHLNVDYIEHIFGHSNVDAIIVDWEFVGLLDGYRKNHPKVKFIVDEDKDKEGQFYDAVKEGWQYDEQTGGNGWDKLVTRAVSEYSLIAVAYTSGTTAKPKGVEYTHRGAFLATVGNITALGLNERVRYLWTLHMSHAMGWTFPWAVTAVRGMHYCLRNMDYTEIWRLLREGNITHFNASPIVNKQLCTHQLAEKLSETVHVTVAGSSPTPHLFKTMANLNLQPVHVYGLTETYGPSVKWYPTRDRIPENERYQSMVRLVHSFMTSLPFRVISTDLPEGEIENVKKNGKEIGEIVFEFNNMCAKGYHKDPEATKKLFAGKVLHTGDLAIWHEDGSIQIMGRQEDIIISGGERFSSVTVESILETHPDVYEAGVVAVPDEEWGERSKAYVFAKSGAHVDGKEVIEWFKDNGVSKFMVPREVEMVEEPLPRTCSGKLKRDILRELAKGGEKKML